MQGNRCFRRRGCLWFLPYGRRWFVYLAGISALTCLSGCPPAINTGLSGQPQAGDAPLTVAFTGSSDIADGTDAKFRDLDPPPDTGGETPGPSVPSTPAAPVKVVGWRWTFGDGATGEGRTSTHVYREPGVYTVSLTVSLSDGREETHTEPDYITVLQPNRPPTADAGTGQEVLAGDTVLLDGSASSDPDDDPLTYQWGFTQRPEGSVAALDNPVAAQPSFVADMPGDYEVSLVVNDGEVDSAPDRVLVVAAQPNRPPVADAGEDQTAVLGATVTLDGSASDDPDEDPLTYQWVFTLLAEGSVAVLSGAETVSPSFVADAPGNYEVSLVVSDGVLESAPDTVRITVEEAPNHAPVAHAGVDREVFVGAQVALDGRGSYDDDDDPLTYSWVLVESPEESQAALDDTTSATPSFPADAPGSFVAELIVNDGTEDSLPDRAAVTVMATQPPRVLVDALAYQVAQGETLEFGVAGDDPDGDVVVLSGAPGLENAAFAATAGVAATGTFSFTPGDGQEGLYALSFTARDPLGLTDTEHVQITVTRTNRPPVLSAPETLEVDEGDEISFVLEASDPDGDLLTLTAAPLPENAVFVPSTATVHFAPDYEQAGSYAVVGEAHDGALSSGEVTIAITVNGVTAEGEATQLVLDVDSVESPTLLDTTRVTGHVNPSAELPAPVQLTSALITGMEPAQGQQGQRLDVLLTGQTAKAFGTSFAAGVSVADFGDGVTVESLTVNAANEAVASIVIDGVAALGPRPVRVQTGTETAVSMPAFNVVAGRTGVRGVVVDPDTGAPVAGALVSIEGTNIQTTTDENGAYILYDVPTGLQTLLINAPDRRLVRQAIDPEPGETHDAGTTETPAIVFDPSAPPSATVVSLAGRRLADTIGEISFEEAQKVVEDTMILTGGANAGMLDEYGNQLNSAFSGEGTLSMTPTGRDLIADRMTRAESFSLQELLYSLSFSLDWTEGYAPDLGAWLALLQEDVNAAWQDPTNPENALLVLLFNKGNNLLREAPVLSPHTRLNALQSFLLTSSILTYATGREKDPASFTPVTKAGADAKESRMPPVAKAGADQSARTGDTIQLDGSRSYLREPSDVFKFAWEIIHRPTDSEAQLSSTSSDRPLFTPDKEGYYKVRLVVADDVLQSIPDFVGILVDNGIPIADAGVDRRAEVGEAVQLSGIQSQDPGGHALSFHWSFYAIPTGSLVEFDSPTAIEPTFTPDYDGEYVVELVVSGGFQSSNSDYVVILAGNRAPEAYAGLNQVVEIGETVQLDGTRSSDPDGDALSYEWRGTTKPAGSAVTISDRQAASPTFTVDEPGTYIVELLVRDGSLASSIDTIEISTDAPHYFERYWRGFFQSKESKLTEAWAGQAYENEMGFWQWSTMLPGGGNVAGASQARGMLGDRATTGAAAFGFFDTLTSTRASLQVPEPPRIKKVEVETAVDGTSKVVVELEGVSVKKETDDATFVYRLYRFQGDTGEREEIEEKSFEDGDNEFELKDDDPFPGTHLYAVNVTRYIRGAREDKFDTHSWWPAAFAGNLTAFKAGEDRLTSDYSESMAVYVGPGDFEVTLSGLEVHPGHSWNTVYYSDAEKGIFYAIDLATGDRAEYAHAGFKQSSRDGVDIVQNGLAIDSGGNLYTDNAASDATFGGRLFRFMQTNGSRELCGSIGYYSRLLQFAHPVFSGPMVIRPKAIPGKESLIVAENLTQELREVPVNEDWDEDRRVGQRYGTLPQGGWGRVIDMEFGENDVLYVLDGLRVLRFYGDGTQDLYVSLTAEQ